MALSLLHREHGCFYRSVAWQRTAENNGAVTTLPSGKSDALRRHISRDEGFVKTTIHKYVYWRLLVLVNALITVQYDEEEKPYVLGRDLHEKLEIKTAYKDWFPRMCEFGFIENEDFCSFLSESTGGRPSVNHQVSIDMAKQICMIQKTELGKRYREYFLELERQWNSPESVMARALKLADRRIDSLKQRVSLLEEKNTVLAEKVEDLTVENKVQSQQIAEMSPKATYYDMVLSCKSAVAITVIAKDYGWSAKKLNDYLSEKGIQYKVSRVWVLKRDFANKGYTKTETGVANGNKFAFINTKWTQAGRLFIYDLLKADGILPIIEQ